MIEYTRVHNGNMSRSIGAAGDDHRKSILASTQIARPIEEKSIHGESPWMRRGKPAQLTVKVTCMPSAKCP